MVKRDNKQNIVGNTPQPDNGVEPRGNGMARTESQGKLLFAKKFTVKEAARLIGVGTTTLRNMVYGGQIPAIKIGSKVMLLEDELENFLVASHVTIKSAPNVRTTMPPRPDFIANSALLSKGPRGQQ